MAWKWIVIKDCLILEVMNLIKWQDLCLLNLIVWNYKIQFSSTDIYKEINIFLALCRYFNLKKKLFHYKSNSNFVFPESELTFESLSPTCNLKKMTENIWKLNSVIHMQTPEEEEDGFTVDRAKEHAWQVILWGEPSAWHRQGHPNRWHNPTGEPWGVNHSKWSPPCSHRGNSCSCQKTGWWGFTEIERGVAGGWGGGGREPILWWRHNKRDILKEIKVIRKITKEIGTNQGVP